MKNMDSAFSLPIRIPYRPPRKLLYFHIFNHAGALICVFASALTMSVKFFLSCVLLLHFMQCFRVLNLARQESRTKVLCLKKDDSWVLLDGDNEIELTLCPAALVHRLLVILCFRYAGKGRHRFILCEDNVDQDKLRRLRVRLLHGKAAYQAEMD